MNGYGEIGERQKPRRLAVWIGALVLLLVFARSICSTLIDYYWWRELGQVPTWLLMSLYRYAPGTAAWLIVFAVLYIAGVNMFVCLGLILLLGTLLFMGVYHLSDTYGQHGLVKRFARKSIPAFLKVSSRKNFLQLQRSTK